MADVKAWATDVVNDIARFWETIKLPAHSGGVRISGTCGRHTHVYHIFMIGQYIIYIYRYCLHAH